MGTSVTMQKSAAIVCLAALLSGANARSLMKMVPASSVDNRVINGNTASLGDFPHAVAILMDGRSLCTGSLISDQWVLTAGHCVEGVSSFDITAGSVSRDSSNLSEGGVVVPASTSILHESYGFPYNDIGLIMLDEPISLTDNIKISTLVEANAEIADGTEVIIAGWGKTTDFSAAATNMQYAPVNVISNAECRQTYGSSITAGHICTTGGSGTESGTCNGDSGSALNLPTPATETGYTTIGVTSFVSGAGCQSDNPDGFLRVSSYIDWISTNTGLEF